MLLVLGTARQTLADGGEALERVVRHLGAVGPRQVGREGAVRGVGLAEDLLVLKRLEAARHLVADGGEALQRVEGVLGAVGPRQVGREGAVQRARGAEDRQVLGALVAARHLLLADGGEALERVVRVLGAVGPRGIRVERSEARLGRAQDLDMLGRLEAARHLVADDIEALERVVRDLGAVGARQGGRERAVARVGLAQGGLVLSGLGAAGRLDELGRGLGAEEELAEGAVLGAHALLEHEKVLARQRLGAEEAVLGAHEEVGGARVVGGDAQRREREVALRRGGRGGRAATLEKRALLIERVELVGDSPRRRGRGRAVVPLALLAVGQLEVAEVDKALRREDAVGAGLPRHFVGNNCAHMSLR